MQIIYITWFYTYTSEVKHLHSHSYEWEVLHLQLVNLVYTDTEVYHIHAQHWSLPL
jgi:hypothetical protein